jgi:hypothetical protein
MLPTVQVRSNTTFLSVVCLLRKKNAKHLQNAVFVCMVIAFTFSLVGLIQPTIPSIIVTLSLLVSILFRAVSNSLIR